jgi:DHA1 family multidrug resistance protein-like MFS transporter
MFFFLPETQPTTILLHRSARLRHLTSNPNIHTQTEIDNRDVKFSATLLDAIVKPLEIGFKDPALAFINVYSMIMYGIYYTYFEVFPLVYIQEYGFTVGEMSLVFLSIIVGCILGIVIYSSYLKFYLTPDILKRGLRAQEHRLVPAIFASFGVPIGLFVFGKSVSRGAVDFAKIVCVCVGWTARRDVHWIASTVGIVIYAACVFIVFQAITCKSYRPPFSNHASLTYSIAYIPMSYPKYAASLFAGNDFCRSLFAFGAVLFGRPMYVDLGVDKGVSLLGGLSVSGIVSLSYWRGKSRSLLL